MSAPRLRAGTSGFSYASWKGAFYPADARPQEFLTHYARALPTVEINNTFYRLPKAAVLEGWCARVPDSFRFVLKASRRITHFGRLRDVDETLAYQWAAAQTLGERAGPTLFQLPPSFQKDLGRLEHCLARIPSGQRAAFEFRHPSWEEEDVRAVLRAAGAAQCCADTDGAAAPDLVVTADFGYLRLRREHYDAADLDRWAQILRAQPWREVFVFFKHEDEASAPRWAQALLERFA